MVNKSSLIERIADLARGAISKVSPTCAMNRIAMGCASFSR